jgi:hypothetical protein
VVTRAGVGVVVHASDRAPRLHRIELTAAQVDSLVAEHLAALVEHDRARGRLPWPAFQERFVEEGAKLLAPLVPFVDEGRTICLVPHGVLHGAALHTLACGGDERPIGLRAPVFVSPSITHWLATRRAAPAAAGAVVATARPEAELADFGEGEAVAAILARAMSGTVARPLPHQTDLDTLGAAPPRRVMHLSSHGVFDADSMEMGLLLSRDGRLPPPPGSDEGSIRPFLARPDAIYRSRIDARLVFLAGCVSSHGAAFPGDDIMGLTRAFFGRGATDLIAGAWTVDAPCVGPFAEEFYAALVERRSVAEAVLAARRRVSRTHPSPFFWGVFQHQGGNRNPLAVAVQ